MIEAAMIWNEPNNKSHWDFEVDPDWTSVRADGRRWPAQAIAAEDPRIAARAGRHFADRSGFHRESAPKGRARTPRRGRACTVFRSTGTSGRSTNGRTKLKEIRSVTNLPIWVTEVGVSTFGAEEVQEFGLQRTAELLIGRVPRIHWYSLYDLPRSWAATTRHREAEGSSYYRHFYMGLLREDGTPKRGDAPLPRLHARHGALPVVPFRGPPAGRRRTLDAKNWVYVTCGRA